MIRTGNGRSRIASAMVAAGLGIGVLAGCADDTAGSEAGTDVGDIQEDPIGAPAAVVDPLVGQTVTVSAEVEGVIGPQAFTLDGTEGPLLVISQQGQGNLVEDTPVAVTGTVRQAFDVVEAEDEFGFDYDDALYEEFEEQNYIVATAVDTTVGDTAATGPGGTTTTASPPTTG